MDILEGLNDKQKRAAVHNDGPLLIVAGAGAGKTKTVAHRIVHLVQNGIAPKEILAITFTNKAAKEMRERVEKLLDESGVVRGPERFFDKPFVSTFHSLGMHILRENGKHVGIPRHFTILDQTDTLAVTKEAVRGASLDPKQFEPRKIHNIISNQKNNLVSRLEFADATANNYFKDIVVEVWEKYERLMKERNSLDFDDLILKTVLLLRDNLEVRKFYQGRWKYIHIDEYQDTNTAQYELSRLLAESHKNICVVGDTDQCFPKNTLVLSKGGEKKIQDVCVGDEVQSAAGNGATCTSKVIKIRKKKYIGDLLKITTKKGFVVETTPEHIFFSRFALRSDVYYVYLMYKKTKGFRIGVVQGSRKTGNKAGDIQIGFTVRSNQEKADRMWVIKVCETKQDAIFWENYYAFSYGIPSVVFHTSGRKIALSQESLDKLFQSIDTPRNANRLLEDMGLSLECPHYTPQGTTQGNTKNKRLNVRLVMFSDKRKSSLHPFGLSRVSINTTDLMLKERLETAGFKTRKGKKNDWRLEIAKLDYGEAERVARQLLAIDPELILHRTALLTDNGRFAFSPASSLREKMELPIMQSGKIVVDEIQSIEKQAYKGDVYDLDIDKTHNYIVNSIPVHNCIYSWRGASIKNMLSFERDYPQSTTVLLEQNYRSTQNILTAANQIIKKNKFRVEKNLFTKNKEGEGITLYNAIDEEDEARFIASEAKKLIEEKGVAPSSIAVLYRANFQSRALETACMKQSVPYQVLGVKFFERKEVRDILSYIQASLNPESLYDIKRIINVPARGIGKVTLAKIFANQREQLPSKVQEKISDFYAILSLIKTKSETEKTSELVKFVLTRSGIESSLQNSTEEDQERLENLKELVTLATKYDDLPAQEGVEALLADAALASDQDSLEKKQDAVKLMTVHASKGLEFKYVFITGLEQDLFPHHKFDETLSKEDQEEERRLFYVAITRAEEKLYLTYASMRTIFGSKQMTVPSEFLSDIDENLLEPVEEAFVEWGSSYTKSRVKDPNEKVVYLDF